MDNKLDLAVARQLVGCCGLYCGLCSKYQSTAPSRCSGCQLGAQHTWCSIWVCCVRKHGLANCAACEELFKCPIFERRKVGEWVPAARNLNQIKDSGIEQWLAEQMARQAVLEYLLQNFNAGRSMSCYCTLCAITPIHLLHRAVEEAQKRVAAEGIAAADLKSKAELFKLIITELSLLGDT